MYSQLHHENYQRLHDAARLKAEALRREAVQDFWRQAARAAWHALRRPSAASFSPEA